MAISKTAGKKDQTEAKFQAALTRRTLRKPAPTYIQGNRSEPVRVYNEDELQSMGLQFFAEVEAHLRFYTDKLGHDVMWFDDWLKKYWAAWSGGIDEAAVHELLSPEVTYKDPLSFGRQMVGIQAFIDYNQAFFDAAPDLRYDAIPGQASISVSPSGELLFMARYSGCGHWDNPLRMYPFTPGSPAIPGNGKFTQLYPVDRYHFNAEGKMIQGETLWDPIDALQLLRVVPSDTSATFKAMAKVGGVASTAVRLKNRLSFVGEN
ncbi:hypothetical protein A5780_38605 [Nocardia sp. 852002-20019_SCH5090214]|jgi:hypothetical protein|uniref:Nuclear transport factor 2 family protein n=1 Tax=Nocardia nova TaxID=37330 RepID=A0A2S5ZYX7_9NOCA|nr:MULTISPECIES: nuclear transport factor 2 family protein [Nocardia]OBA43796.1 hypothetical protein A5780_38605 [Nocardia sp. 852002-20019_SCH5090214]PPI93222.1 nuclear transport factor 2 family protein [Nocardia nova]PPJ21250.1 nuclear transport factor 2 family protein [Nocardia nova]PPJ23423.1 nuclear transport factor 2 family protein [Nocardia nova]